MSAGVAAELAYQFWFGSNNIHLDRGVGLALLIGAPTLTLAVSKNAYQPERLLDARSGITFFSVTFLATILVLLLAVFFMRAGTDLSRGSFAIFAIISLLLVSANRIFWSIAIRRLFRMGRLASSRVLLLSELGSVAADVTSSLRQRGFRIAKRLVIHPDGRDEVERLAAETIHLARGSEIQEIFVAASINHLPMVIDLVNRLRMLPLPIRFLPDSGTSLLVGADWQPLGSAIAVELQRAPLNLSERAMKRSLDIFVAMSAFVFLGPLIVAIACAIVVESGRPIVFRQRRRGFNGREFVMYKFRSMFVEQPQPAAEGPGELRQATKGDPRVTPLGRFLRRTSLDELPQLLNVLAGSMSLVGPRPHAVQHDDIYDARIADYAFRHHVKPGLTGWAQVNGARGETPHISDMERRVVYDLWYVNNWSLLLDVKIIVMTALEVVRSDTAY